MNILKSRTKNRICFVHVPKCGGQSVKSAIAKEYNSRLETVRVKAAPSLKGASVEDVKDTSILHRYRENLLRYFLSDPDVGLIMGHYPCRKETLDFYREEWRFVTILRNPVDRFISHFLYNTHKRSEHFKQDMALEEYLTTPRAKASGEMYVRYFSNYPIGTIDDGIRDAKVNLDMFSSVGVLEKLDEWKKEYESRFGGRLKIGKSNSSPSGARKAKGEISEEQLALIEKLCQPSMEIYNYALNRNIV